MDIRMPGVDGLEATRAIAADELLAGVRIVILTTFDLDEYVFEALRVGASGFLVKNTEPADLIRGVRRSPPATPCCPRGDRRLVAEFATRAKEPRPSPSWASSPTASARSWAWSRPACPTTRSPASWSSARRRQDPRQPGHGQAQGSRPRPTGRLRLRVRPGPPGFKLALTTHDERSGTVRSTITAIQMGIRTAFVVQLALGLNLDR